MADCRARLDCSDPSNEPLTRLARNRHAELAAAAAQNSHEVLDGLPGEIPRQGRRPIGLRHSARQAAGLAPARLTGVLSGPLRLELKQPLPKLSRRNGPVRFQVRGGFVELLGELARLALGFTLSQSAWIVRH